MTVRLETHTDEENVMEQYVSACGRWHRVAGGQPSCSRWYSRWYGGLPPATRWKVWCERERVVGREIWREGGGRGGVKTSEVIKVVVITFFFSAEGLAIPLSRKECSAPCYNLAIGTGVGLD